MTDYIKSLRELIGHKPLVLSTAGVLVIDDENRVLLQFRVDNNTWCPPGGIIEPGELAKETAIREVYEETGLIVENLEFFKVYSGEEQHYIYPNGDEVYYVSVTYITCSFKGEIYIDGIESKDVKFFHVDDLPKNITSPVKPHLNDLKDWLYKK
ncbi:MAG: NUDIX hydrolase [Firmicutes bacterium]|nr:NUDIX hydrolase [Bacillota bacterium]